MNIEQAKSECQRWLDHLDRQREKSEAVQKLAAQCRAGLISVEDGKRAIRQLDNPSSVTVYDGARLAEAVEVLMKAS